MSTVNIHNNPESFVAASGNFVNSEVYVENDSSEANLKEGRISIGRVATNHFTGRKEQLDMLAKCLCPFDNSSTSLSRRVFVLYGLGGVGKTHLCLKFIELYEKRFWAVVWIDASTEITARNDFAEIANSRKHQNYDLRQREKIGKQMLSATKKHWLLVIDNAEAQKDVSTHFPYGTTGCILITTRYPEMEIYARPSNSDGPTMSHKMEGMDIEEGVNLLLKVANKQDTAESHDQAKKIVEELGHLPLALAQAGATMRYRDGSAPSIPLESYLGEFRKNKDNLLQSRPIQGTFDYQNSVYTTWVISRKMIETMNSTKGDPRASRDAIDILDICSHLHFEDIPCRIFRMVPGRGQVSRMQQIVTPLRSIALLRTVIGAPTNFGWSPDRIAQAVHLLASYSLVDLDGKSDVEKLSIHRLVQSWSGYYLRHNSTKHDQKWAKFATATCLSHAIQRQERKGEYFSLRRRLLPHVEAFLHALGELYQVTNTFEAQVAHDFSAVFSENGNYPKAEKLLRTALEWRQTNSQPRDPAVPKTMTDLAVILSKMAQYGKANEMSTKAIKEILDIRGQFDPETLQSRSSLAMALRGAGRFHEAKRTYSCILDKYRKILGEDAPPTLEIINDLADTLQALGEFDEAVKMSRQALAARERTLGQDHPYTLESLNSLAVNLEYQGTDLREAENLCQRTWEKHKKILGAHHPNTLSSLSQLARSQLKQGNIADAEEKYKEVMRMRSECLGPDHPDTVFGKIDLVEVSLSRKDFEAAKTTYEEALRSLKRNLDKDHPYILILKTNLAVVFRYLGERANKSGQDEVKKSHYDKARGIYNEVRDAYSRLENLHHPNAHMCLVNLSALLREEGLLDKAEKLTREAVDGYEKTLGRHHRHTLMSLKSLAQTLNKAGRYDEAAKYGSEVISGLWTVYGCDTPETLDTVALLAHIEHRRNRYIEAERLYRRACKGYKNLGETTHWCFRYFDSFIEDMKKHGNLL